MMTRISPPTEVLDSAEPLVSRVRHSPKFRMLTVARVRDLTPHMRRITLTGEDLAGFVSAGFDDHVKLFFPRPGDDEPARPAMGADGRSVWDDESRKPPSRDFTPRRYDAAAGELDIDFALHDSGPATDWAAQARPGSKLGVGGPRGSFVISTAFGWHLLIGDETAIPAIGRRLEELPAAAHALVIVEVANASEQMSFASDATFDVTWVHRDGARPGSVEGLDRAARALRLPPGQGYAWVAAETAVAKQLRRTLIERGADKRWLRAAGYWKQGAEATHDMHDD
jgi:NADPH-dependent ferric siderophore reductase